MKRLSVLFAIVCLLSMNLFALSYESVQGDPTQTRIYTLKNGLKVFLSVNKENPRITAHIAVNTGSRNDPKETTGLAHYLEHIMFKGTQSFGTTDYAAEKPYLEKIRDLYEEYRVMKDPQQRKAKYHEIDSVSQIAAQYNIPNEYDKMMSGIGSLESNAYTSNDITCYMENIPSNELERWCMVEGDRFQNMVIRGFHTELEAVYEEKNISMANDDEKAIEALLLKLFPTHPYGTQTTIGTQEHLKNPSLVNIRNYFNKYYVPNNVAICMAGDLDPEQTIALIEKYFGQWKSGNDVTPPSYGPQPVFTVPQDTTVLGQEMESTIIAWRMKGAADIQMDTLAMADMLLSNAQVGLIDLNINQKMTMLGAGSDVWNMKDYSLYTLYGTPNEGQSLAEVRELLLAEIEKLKKGEWDERLLKSIIDNAKLNEFKRLDDNGARVENMKSSFINGISWEQLVGTLDRMAKLTKADIVKWANEHFTEGYVYVDKKKGEDTTLVKIEKPAITAIPSNRNYKSKFLDRYEKMEAEPIQPQFVDFQKELTFTTTKSGLPVIYKKNELDARFSLIYYFEFGFLADKRYNTAEDYYGLLGTNKKTVEQIKRDFYDIACSFSITVGERTSSISLSGLQENMPKAVAMLDNVLQNLKPDATLYNKYVEQVMKSRMENRTNQDKCYAALVMYGKYGAKNPITDQPTMAEYLNTNPKVYTDLIKGMNGIKHQVLYWGPASEKELSDIISKYHKTPKKLADAPVNVPYKMLTTDNTEVIIAPYDAKNINMRMVSNENRPFSLERKPVISIFNEYFGGNMNAIVFQELREARGLAYNAWATYASPSHLDENEFYQEHIISQNDKMMDCINTFKEITDTIPMSEALLNTSKQSIMKTIAAARTTKMGAISKYISAKRMGINYDFNRVLFEKIPAITLPDIQKFEEESIKGKPLRYLILGKEEDLDIPALEKLAPIKRVTLDDIFPAYK